MKALLKLVSMRRVVFVSLMVWGVVLFGACGSASAPEGGVVVTFRVADKEDYKIRLTKPADIENARKLLAGEEAPSIPNGVVVRGTPDANTGYSWHIDPNSLEFADMTTEVCDGLPSDVEKGIVTSDRYCPWHVKVIAIDGANQ